MHKVSYRSNRQLLCLLTVCLCCSALAAKEKKKQPTPNAMSPIDALLANPDTRRTNVMTASSPGSLFASSDLLVDLASDVRARNVGDLVTVVVLDQASATSAGTTTSQRTTSAAANITSLLGPKSAHGALSNLLNASGQQKLNGQGTTSRQTTVSTTVSGRVLGVLPNGDLIIEANKLILINSEYQTVSVRGVVRQVDLGQSDSVSSNQVEFLELRVNGKGVVADAIRRPNALYRLLLGILPF
jgi:flagellar L-ring protein precursor FlgH